MAHTELSMADLHGQTTKEVMGAVAADSIIPTGAYLCKVNKVLLKQYSEDDQYNPGRSMADLGVTFLDPESPKKKVGSAFISVSWQLRLNQDGKPDTASKRWSELQRAVGGKTNDPSEVLKSAEKQLFMVRGQESYTIEDSTDLHPEHEDRNIFNGKYYISLGEDQEEIREHYLDLGYEPKFRISRIYKAK